MVRRAMKRSKLKQGDAVRVSWFDSMALNGWKYTTEGLGEAGKIQTLGYVAHRGIEALAVTSSIGGTGAVLDPVNIPWKAIIKLEKLGSQWDR